MKRLGLFLLALFALVSAGLSQAAPVYAMNSQQRLIYDNSIEYFNYKPDDLGSAAAQAAAGASNCVGGGSSGTGAPLVGSDNQQKAYNFFVSKGLTPAQSSGIVGNLIQESQVNPTLTGASGLGIAQWIGGRRTAAEAFAAKQGKPATDLGVQLDYLWAELNGTDGVTKEAGLAQVQAASTPGDAAIAFQNNFERCNPAKCNQQARVNNANAVMARYGSGLATGTAPVGDSTAGATASGGCTGGGASGASGVIASSADCGDPVSCAKKLIAMKNAGQIDIWPPAMTNLQTIADGQQITTCNPPGAMVLDANLLSILIRLAGGYKIAIHNFSNSLPGPNAKPAGGHDCDGSTHVLGRGTDIELTTLSPTAANLGTPTYHAFAQSIIDLLPHGSGWQAGGIGQKQYLSQGGTFNNISGLRYFNDAPAHIHMDIGYPAGYTPK